MFLRKQCASNYCFELRLLVAKVNNTSVYENKACCVTLFLNYLWSIVCRCLPEAFVKELCNFARRTSCTEKLENYPENFHVSVCFSSFGCASARFEHKTTWILCRPSTRATSGI